MDLTQAINQPLAVVLILFVVLGFGMMAVREFFFFMKSVQKKTPIDKLNTTQHELSEVISGVTGALQKQTEVLNNISKNQELHERLCEMRYETLLREVSGQRP